MNKPVVLETKNLSKSFGKRRVVDDINLRVTEGEIYGFLGPNGAGKTTTIRLILDLIHPDSGKVFINGFDVRREYSQAISQVGAIVETPSLHSYLTGYNNLKLIANLLPNVDQERIRQVLDSVGLSTRAGDKVSTYSLGMKQRLGLAQALLHRPALVILDEPTNGLDPKGMIEIRETIRNLAMSEQITFLISTHLLHEVEQICDSVGILRHGKLLAQGNVEDLLSNDYETLTIGTKALTAASEMLKNAPYVKEVAVIKGDLQVRIDKGYGASVNSLLVTNHIDVTCLIPKSQSLESFFMELTDGGEL